MNSQPDSTKPGLKLVREGDAPVSAPQEKGKPKVRKARPEKELPALEYQRAEKAFAEMAAQIATASGVAEAQRVQLAAIHSLLKPRACFIARHAGERDQLQITTVRGRNDERIAAAAPGVGPVGLAFSERRVVREEGLVVAPVLSGEAVIGCLAVLGSKYAVSDDLMAALAAQVSAGVEVARLREEAAGRTKDLLTAVAGLKALEKSREDLLANISHDLKTPLTTINAYLTLLGRSTLGEVNEKQAKAVETCARSADRLLRMINDLLLVSRLHTGKMELNERPFGLKGLVEEVMQALAATASQAQVKLKLVPSPEVYVRGDRDRMLEAVTNLTEAAVHNSGAAAEVRLKVDALESGLAEVTVDDLGWNMPEEDLKHVFDAYHRPTSGGKSDGLALSIVAKIVHLHGGKIEAGPADPSGSRFRIHLPMFAGAVNLPEVGAAPRPGGILLVEDDADCREVLQQVLEMEGYRVVPATSATEAKNLLATLRPGLVLLDLRLSEEDGMSVLHHIRQTPGLAETAVYIISGARDVASLSAGTGIDRIDGFFEKPLQVGKVLDTVASVVRPIAPLPEPG